MGRAAKLKAARKEMRKDEEKQKLMRKEIKRKINKGMSGTLSEFVDNNVFMILATLVDQFGFGPVRLERFMDAWKAEAAKIKVYFEQDIEGEDVMLEAEEKVKRAGFSLEEWVRKNGPLC